MRKLTLLFVLFSVSFVAGCPRYAAVRRLSTEQLGVQEKLKTNFTDYYNAMDKLLTSQSASLIALIEIETAEQIEARNHQLSINLGAATTQQERYTLAKAASADVEKFSKDSATKKQLILSRVALITAKHAEIITAYEAMYAAQAELDRYIQLKKVDEVLAESLSNRFKINQEKLSRATTTATTATSELFDLMKRK